MTKLSFLFIALIGGILAGSQASINGELGKRIGGFEAAFVSFFIGTVFLTLCMIFFGRGQVLQVFSLPKWQLVGGILGALFVASIIFSVPVTGAALAIFAAILGQILISLIIDHFGLFGMKRIPMNIERVLGVSLMAAGLLLIYRGSFTN
ncbi:DMT family transporter [Bacillus shivajii]|uniref:DMT family transporter n=1 Tax=Bacillus shivajii TaxID=1983719 RepID=UPI001CFB23C5|nr:DMT family transporter [Bacillus shivajii]UCZ51413.1 DMT family transporter [Bacillus shivajii]